MSANGLIAYGEERYTATQIVALTRALKAHEATEAGEWRNDELIRLINRHHPITVDHEQLPADLLWANDVIATALGRGK